MLFPLPHQRLRPYIFSESDVARLLAASSRLLPAPSSPLRAEVIHLVIALLHTTGMRCGELLRLTAGDYDAKEGTLLVRDSKFHKSRVLPLHHDMVNEIDRHLQLRRKLHLSMSPETPLIWNSRGGGRHYTPTGLQGNLKILLNQCNIRTAQGRLPRIHDFRHSFAVNALLRWYRMGVDVDTKLPLLATYLGHGSAVSTHHYLHFIEPLRTAASKRFSHRCSPHPPSLARLACELRWTSPTCLTCPTCLTYSSPSTSFIVNQPRLPWIHFAARSAPRAKAERSRAACESVMVSAGPSKPTVCVPGMHPARVDDTSIGRAKPACSIACFSRSAVPDGASVFAA